MVNASKKPLFIEGLLIRLSSSYSYKHEVNQFLKIGALNLKIYFYRSSNFHEIHLIYV